MYYLLGYKLFGEKEGEMMKKLSKINRKVSPDHVGKSFIFQAMEEKLLTQVTVVSHAYVFVVIISRNGILQSVRFTVLTNIMYNILVVHSNCARRSLIKINNSITEPHTMLC